MEYKNTMPQFGGQNQNKPEDIVSPPDMSTALPHNTHQTLIVLAILAVTLVLVALGVSLLSPSQEKVREEISDTERQQIIDALNATPKREVSETERSQIIERLSETPVRTVSPEERENILKALQQ